MLFLKIVRLSFSTPSCKYSPVGIFCINLYRYVVYHVVLQCLQAGCIFLKR